MGNRTSLEITILDMGKIDRHAIKRSSLPSLLNGAKVPYIGCCAAPIMRRWLEQATARIARHTSKFRWPAKMERRHSKRHCRILCINHSSSCVTISKNLIITKLYSQTRSSPTYLESNASSTLSISICSRRNLIITRIYQEFAFTVEIQLPAKSEPGRVMVRRSCLSLKRH